MAGDDSAVFGGTAYPGVLIGGPDWFFNSIHSEVGDSEIEKEVFCKVASYGKQIGMLTEVLLSIADELEIDNKKIESLSELKKIQAKIEAIKRSKKERVRENAKTLLDKLKNSDREGLESLLREYGASR